jgi:dTDP-4-amino-4,6-dideoxygalactose transaminase
VIVPSNTYIATWLAVTQAGATPVPVEPDDAHVQPRSRPRRGGGHAAHERASCRCTCTGQPADMDAINAVAARHGLVVLEDAAQAHGARYAAGAPARWATRRRGASIPARTSGAFGDAGGVDHDDDALADRLRVLRNYGSRVKYVNEVQG